MSRKRFATRGERRTKCPICGGEIEVSDLYQYAHAYRMTKSGRLSKKYNVIECGSMEARVAGCASGCGADWDTDQFEITAEGYFIDYKYKNEE